MTIVVTGANGHLGGNLVRMLLDAGHEVRAVINRNQDALEGLDIELVSGNVMDQASLEAAFVGAETVYHLAAKISIKGDPDGSVKAINVQGAANAANAALAADVTNYVHVSSVHSFDLTARGPVTEASPRAGSHNAAYDHSKFLGEQAVREVGDLHAVFVNPTGVIGPVDFQPSRMGKVFLDLKAGKLPALVNGGFDFVDVRDVAKGIIAAGARGKKHENYLLGGHFVPVPELGRMASAVTGTPSPRMALPIWAARLGLPFAKLTGDDSFTSESLDALQHGKVVDHSKAARELGHDPRPIDQTIADIYDWFA